MPSISRFFGIVIYMYPDDHDPPHFHALCDDRSCIVDIYKAKARGNLTKKEKKLVEAWAVIHKDELINNWDLMIKENRLNDIEPLK